MEKPANVKVFLLDDDEDDYLIVKNVLARVTNSPYTLSWSADYDEAIKIIKKCEHDAYLIDYRLGLHDGLEALREVNAHNRKEPFIFLTGAEDNKLEATAVRLGASDYLVKGSYTPELLSRTLRYAIQRKEIEEERVAELVAINRSKDEFISLASHQLRTPATAVKQYVGMLLEGFLGKVSETQKEILQAAYNSNERQIDIVNELLNVAKIDAGEVKLRQKVFDIKHVVQGIVDDQSKKFSDRQQTVSVRIDKTFDDKIRADKLYVGMALDNLIDNASKYSPEGTAIVVSIKRVGDDAKIAIQDHGVGIADDDMPRLFQKFSRIDNPLSSLVGGSGLGLYWCQKVIDLHGGELTVKSKIGQGSTFTVSLPLPKDA